jgi:hypothetical protein
MARTSYILRKVYVVNMTWLTIRKTFVTNVEIYKLTEFPNDFFFI